MDHALVRELQERPAVAAGVAGALVLGLCSAAFGGSDALAELSQQLARENALLREQLAGQALPEGVGSVPPGGGSAAAHDDGPTGGETLLALALAVCVLLLCGTTALFVRSELALRDVQASKGAEFRLREFALYRIDYWFSASSLSKPAALLFATGVLISVSGALYMVVTGETVVASLWAAWTFVADPGTHADEVELLPRVVSFGATIGGMLFFALMIGIVAEAIASEIDSLKKGRSRVIETGHTLVLGWGDKLIPTIKQLAEANESEGGGVVVVLAPVDKEEMEAYIDSAELDLQGTIVVCRSGSSISMPDLRKVSAVTARSIIVLADHSTGMTADMSDSRAVRAVLSLRGMGAPAEGHIVVEMCDVDNRDLVALAGGESVEVVVAHDVIGRLMIQCARQPGLAQVLEDLLGFEGCEFYLAEWPRLAGKTFGEAHFSFPLAVPVGLQSARDGAVFLNPPDATVLQPGDRLLCLAEDDDSYEDSTELPAAASTAVTVPTRPADERLPERLLFCGWRRDVDDVIMELDKYVPAGSTLTMMSTVPLAEREQLLEDGGLSVASLRNLQLLHEMGNPVLRKHLEALPIEAYDSVLILADEAIEADMGSSDSRSLATLLLVRDIQQQRAQLRAAGAAKAVLISEILDARTKSLIAVAQISDYVLSNELVSMALAMVSEQREINKVLDELFSAEGNEIYLRPCELYVAHGTEASFYDLMRLARARDEVCVGFRPAGGAPAVLNPDDKASRRQWGPGDLVVVLADE